MAAEALNLFHDSHPTRGAHPTPHPLDIPSTPPRRPLAIPSPPPGSLLTDQRDADWLCERVPSVGERRAPQRQVDPVRVGQPELGEDDPVRALRLHHQRDAPDVGDVVHRQHVLVGDVAEERLRREGRDG